MRKITLSLLAISFFIFTLCSCGVTQPSAPVTEFKASATVETGEEKYNITVESTPDGCIKITVNEPKVLENMQYTYTKDTLYIEYEKLKCNATSDYLRQEAFADVIYRALSFDKTNPLKIKESDSEHTTYIVTCDYGEVELLCDTKSGAIKEITPSYADVKIEFIDQKETRLS